MTVIRLKYLLVLLLFVCCKTHKKNFIVKEILLSFSGGNTYPELSNLGNFRIAVKEKDSSKTTSRSKKTFDAYCPLKNPVQVLMTKKKSLIFLGSHKKDFFLGKLDDKDSLCIYDCNLTTPARSKITFNSYINRIPYWHGLSPLGGLSLFMHYHHYRLTIQNDNGKRLFMHWKYSVYKLKHSSKRKKKWSDDYCEDGGGGLVGIRIQ